MGLLALCLILNALTVPLSAESFPSCVKKSSSTTQEPPTLAALIKCHKEKLEAAKLAYAKAHRAPPPDLAVERWEDLQREEVRDFLARHADQASLVEPLGITSTIEQDAEDLKELAAGPRKKELTPEMAAEIVLYLQKEQKEKGRDMQGLLKAIKMDGDRLSPDTMRRLKEAALQSRDDGVYLRDKPEIEEFLLPKEPPHAAIPNPWGPNHR